MVSDPADYLRSVVPDSLAVLASDAAPVPASMSRENMTRQRARPFVFFRPLDPMTKATKPVVNLPKLSLQSRRRRLFSRQEK